MNLLIYDNNQDDFLKFASILKILPIEVFLDKVSHYQDGVDFYNKYVYDIVFIDFADDIGKKLLASILDINPKQKIVTMSEINSCSDFIGCDNCK